MQSCYEVAAREHFGEDRSIDTDLEQLPRSTQLGGARIVCDEQGILLALVGS